MLCGGWGRGFWAAYKSVESTNNGVSTGLLLVADLEDLEVAALPGIWAVPDF